MPLRPASKFNIVSTFSEGPISLGEKLDGTFCNLPHLKPLLSPDILDRVIAYFIDAHPESLPWIQKPEL